MREISEIFGKVKIIKSETYADDRGMLQQVYNSEIDSLLSLNAKGICHVYYSISRNKTIRGLHYQYGVEQGRLISLISGTILDVIVDLRKDSKTFGHHQRVILEPSSLVWIPSGFAHGFQALSDDTIMLYQCTGPYSPESERCINVFDKRLNIVWEDTKDAIISQKDLMGIDFKNADYF